NQIKSTQIKSNQIKSNQIKSNQIKSNQIKSNQIKSNQIKTEGTLHWNLALDRGDAPDWTKTLYYNKLQNPLYIYTCKANEIFLKKNRTGLGWTGLSWT
ncbi:hypothetical protein PHYBLDRAFT_105618, partial [Phycomyces blakesleeanus NRRL 1555(-)]